MLYYSLTRQGILMLKNELVVKSNRLIEASYRLTLNEQRIILYAICRCREEQTGLLLTSRLSLQQMLSPINSPLRGKVTSTSN